MNIAITGASGYLGAALARSLRGDGHNVSTFCRDPQNISDIKFSLSSPFESNNIFSSLNIDTLIHCAWDLSLKRAGDSQIVNVDNSIKFLQMAKEENNVKIIFISSMSSFDGCKSIYGKQKMKVEKAVLSMGGVVLRPGLIWGPRCTSGMFSILTGLAERLPIIPMIGFGKNALYLSHVDDLTALVHRLLTGVHRLNSFVITAASPQPVTFRKILEICGELVGKRPILLPIPYKLCLYVLLAIEFFRIPIPIRSDSVIGLIFSDQNPNFDQSKFERIGFEGFRNFNKN